jgi:beta-aspartyl-dipeptidase (metallo-type)
VFDEACQFAAEGGRIDLTAGIGEHPPAINVATAVRLAVDRGVPLDRISVSSDANGSLPIFNEDGSLVRLDVASQKTLLEQLAKIVRDGVLELPEAAAFFTANPARFYGLDRKGRVSPGADADLMLLDSDFRLVHVLARGRRAVTDGSVVLRGTFST